VENRASSASLNDNVRAAGADVTRLPTGGIADSSMACARATAGPSTMQAARNIFSTVRSPNQTQAAKRLAAFFCKKEGFFPAGGVGRDQPRALGSLPFH
jgi:hypothetical protein